jgi:uncharacterized protein YhbP (UPF0306 family)
MPYRLSSPQSDPSEESLRESLEAILAGRSLLSLATAGDAGPHVNVAFFAVDDGLTLYFVSERTTTHSGNVGSDPRAAASVFLDPPEFGEQLRGVQLFGRVTEVRGTAVEEAVSCYQGRFSAFAQDPSARRAILTGEASVALYRFLVDAVTLLDEPRFGRRRYLKATVSR